MWIFRAGELWGLLFVRHASSFLQGNLIRLTVNLFYKKLELAGLLEEPERVAYALSPARNL